MQKMKSGEKIALGAAAALALAVAWNKSQNGSGNDENLTENKKKKVDAINYKNRPDKFLEIFESLESEVNEITRHHRRRRHEGHVFNIKTHAFAPYWVENFIDSNHAYEIIDSYKSDELQNFIYSIQDKGSEIYQDWFDGDYEVTGRSGGYLTLASNIKSKIEDALNIIYNHADEFVKETHFVGSKLLTSDENVEELESIANDVIDEIEKVNELEKKIEEMKKELTEYLEGDDFWESYIIDNDIATAEEIEKAKQK